MTVSTTTNELPTRLPELGELVQVRSRRWLVEEVIPPPVPGQSALVRLACADDDAQGQALDVFWDYEIDRRILEEEGWQDRSAKGFDPPRQFAAFLHTLRWSCVTATDPNLFQAPFRAGIKVSAGLRSAAERGRRRFQRTRAERRRDADAGSGSLADATAEAAGGTTWRIKM